MTTTTPPTLGLVRYNECYLQTVEITGKVSNDQTGRFPYLSCRGTKNIIVLHNYYSNAILVVPVKTKSTIHKLQATQALHGYLNEQGLNPKLHVMDSECPNTVKNTRATTKLLLSSSPPHPSNEYGGKLYLHVQRSLSRQPVQCTSQLSHAFVVLLDSACHHNSQSSAPLANQPKALGRSTPQRILRL